MLINSVWIKEDLLEEWKVSIIVPFYEKGCKTHSSNYSGIPRLSTIYKIVSNILRSRLCHIQRKLLCISAVDFDATGQLLIIYSAFIKYLRKNWNTVKQCISYVQTSRRLMIKLRGRFVYYCY